MVDGSNAGFCMELKTKFGESVNYDSSSINPETMHVLPINFNTEHKEMLSNLHMFVNKEYLAILEKFDKLIVGLRTAYSKEYSLDKEQNIGLDPINTDTSSNLSDLQSRHSRHHFRLIATGMIFPTTTQKGNMIIIV